MSEICGNIKMVKTKAGVVGGQTKKVVKTMKTGDIMEYVAIILNTLMDTIDENQVSTKNLV